MNMLRAVELRLLLQPLPEARLFRHHGKVHIINQGIQVEPGAPRYNGSFAVSEYFFNIFFRKDLILRNGKFVSRVDLVHQIMPRLGQLFFGGFGAADVHIFIDLHGISRNDLSLKSLRNFNRIFCFADGRGAGNKDNFMILHF
ncbi:hypothetical protein SDC9_189619 [bioreactor metagenome]|uniref:Uncharacterized protein n=1 Tax=bioreactor metagenome TaxID=1076179 RepID=A0A645I3K6_9ZZZZ